MKILVLGASGMLGNAMMAVLSQNKSFEVFGTLRSPAAKRFFPEEMGQRLIAGVDVESHDSLAKVFGQVHPDVVINCIGLIKQLPDHDDPLVALPINSLLPHRLARLCQVGGARLVHFSTDCVFSGRKGGYVESDTSDAEDVYGKSKYLGEVDYPHAITLRSSIIGHELQSAHGLVGWFLSQQGRCPGFTKAIFSGLPTVEMSRVVRDVVIPRPELSGLYHVAARPIAKYDLLLLVAKVYGKTIDIVPDDKLVIDRSLDATRFQSATGYIAPEWPDLIKLMHSSRK
jgi:dTDP-4-dehydrorhamnose reductase